MLRSNDLVIMETMMKFEQKLFNRDAEADVGPPRIYEVLNQNVSKEAFSLSPVDGTTKNFIKN